LVVGLTIVTLGLGGLVEWQTLHPPELRLVRILGAVDATRGQQWQNLPKSVQEALTATYARSGATSPAPHKKKPQLSPFTSLTSLK
jgi:hypothetical protein